MSQNPYTPPQSDVGSGDDPQRRGSGAKAVCIGLVVDIGGTFLLGAGVTIAWFIAAGLPNDSESLQQLTQSPAYFATSTILGGACTVLGGYVAARIANHSEYRYALYLGFWSLAFGIPFVVWSPSAQLWQDIASLLLVVPCALAGGYLRLATKPRR